MVKKRFWPKRWGLPPKRPIHWKYYGGVWHEVKKKPRKWTFSYKSLKRRRAKSYGGLGKDSTGLWKIDGFQRVKKIGMGQYQTHLFGKKTSLGFNVVPPKKKRLYR